MAYGDFKDLPRKTTSDKVLRDKGFNIAKNSKYHVYQKGLASMVYTFFDKKSSSFAEKSAKGNGFAIKQNQLLPKELSKSSIKNFKNVKYIHYLKTLFGVMILQICN